MLRGAARVRARARRRSPAPPCRPAPFVCARRYPNARYCAPLEAISRDSLAAFFAGADSDAQLSALSARLSEALGAPGGAWIAEPDAL